MTPRNMAYIVCFLGATAVIGKNASTAVSEMLFNLHGLWKTDEAKDMYVLETECNRLSVTKYLGI